MICSMYLNFPFLRPNLVKDFQSNKDQKRGYIPEDHNMKYVLCTYLHGLQSLGLIFSMEFNQFEGCKDIHIEQPESVYFL